MTTNVTSPVEAVKKSVIVNASLDHAFKVFTDGFDTWWPRSHHIGKQPLVTAVIETHAGGRCFGREADGTECDWGRVLTWEPPHRIVLAWQIGPTWQYEPDITKASEVEVRFSSEAGGLTRVDLEHRHFERHGKDADKVRIPVSGPGGWEGLLQIYARRGHVYHPAVGPAAFIFASNDSLAERSFAGIAEGDLWRRPTPQSNPMLWMLGHMAETRARLLKALGDDCATGWGDVFGRGAALQDAARYPSRDQINEVSREVSRRLFAKLATLTDADLSREAKGPRPNSVRTIGDQIAFLAMHDSYHVGQLAYARKALGHPGVVG